MEIWNTCNVAWSILLNFTIIPFLDDTDHIRAKSLEI